ncbi:MAG: ABC transporter ATP-binding protein [Opitutaceae bacterium]|nr:ABC transporter ATP-binding protein [Opitutaceae bacterium]
MPAVPLLAVEDFSLHFATPQGLARVLDAVNLQLAAGETVGLVGESGSGKTVLALALLGLLGPAARAAGGRIRLDGRDLLGLDERERARLRGGQIAMAFQNYRGALNPIRRVGDQLGDVLRRHAGLSRRAARARAIELLAQVRIPDPERRCDAYPFELSGGMCQRVMIALALSCRPRLLLADEPVTGLDVTTQAVVMDLVMDLARDHGTAVLLITHDLALAAERCARVAVMHAGQIVETAPAGVLFSRPRHPYTAKLLAATPGGQPDIASLPVIPGGVPDTTRPLPPCRFALRCDRRVAACDLAPLVPEVVGPAHHLWCRRPVAVG